MTTNPPAPVDPVLLLLGAVCLAAEALAIVLAATLALLLTIAGWRPTPDPGAALPVALAITAPAVAPITAGPALLPLAGPLDRLTVAQLRRLARSAGLPQLARSGRRSELLVALAPG